MWATLATLLGLCCFYGSAPVRGVVLVRVIRVSAEFVLERGRVEEHLIHMGDFEHIVRVKCSARVSVQG